MPKKNCKSCAPSYKYTPKCVIPQSTCWPTDNLLQTPCNGSVYRQSVTSPDSTTHVLDTRFGVDMIVSVNNGIPSSIFNVGTCSPSVDYPVPVFLQEISGNTKSDDYIYLNNVLDPAANQTEILSPELGVSTTTALVGDVGNRFALGVIPMYNVTSSTSDTGGTYSTFTICNPNHFINLRITTHSVTLAGEDLPITRVKCVEDISPDCPSGTALHFNTFRMAALSPSGEANTGTVEVTFVKNVCGEFSIGLVHGQAADTVAGQCYPRQDDDDEQVQIEWETYNMVVCRGTGCPSVDPSQLVNIYDNNLFNGIYSTASSLVNSTIANVIIELKDGTKIEPGNLKVSERAIMTKESSESLVQMYFDSIDKFNQYIRQVNGE